MFVKKVICCRSTNVDCRSHRLLLLGQYRSRIYISMGAGANEQTCPVLGNPKRIANAESDFGVARPFEFPHRSDLDLNSV